VSKIPDLGGPLYPQLGPGVEKYRRLARKGLAKMAREDRYAYGEAVELAILSLQRRELDRETKTPDRRNEPLGDARLKMLRNQLLAWPDQERRARSEVEWKSMYDAAMAEKRKAAEAKPVARRKRSWTAKKAAWCAGQALKRA